MKKFSDELNEDSEFSKFLNESNKTSEEVVQEMKKILVDKDIDVKSKVTDVKPKTIPIED